MVRVKEERKIDLPHFTPHDLRRTGATLISKLDFRDEIVDAILAHLKKGTIKIYNRHGYDDEKRKAMLALESLLHSLVREKRPIYRLENGKCVKINHSNDLDP